MRLSVNLIAAGKVWHSGTDVPEDVIPERLLSFEVVDNEIARDEPEPVEVVRRKLHGFNKGEPVVEETAPVQIEGRRKKLFAKVKDLPPLRKGGRFVSRRDAGE